MVDGMKVPTARPRTICSAISNEGSRVSGGRAEVIRKVALDHSRMRRGPSAMLNHAAERHTTIWAAPNTVDSQDPSSKPSDRPPRISASPTVVMRELMVEMKAPTTTAATPRSGW
jgi:hypothetical protein